MSWRPITIDNVRFTPAETAIMQNIQGSSNIGAEVLQNVVGEFVEAIQQGGNQFANDGTIPDVVRMHVINRARWLWLCEFPVLKSMQTEWRRSLNDSAEKFRDAIAAGSPRIAPPVNPVLTPTSLVTMPSLGPIKLKHFTAHAEDGL